MAAIGTAAQTVLSGPDSIPCHSACVSMMSLPKLLALMGHDVGEWTGEGGSSLLLCILPVQAAVVPEVVLVLLK